jgi:predicted nucleic acid-binding protein
MMSAVLVDSSVWTDHFRGTATLHTQILGELLDKGATVCICPPVLQEILQGITDSRQFHFVKTHLLRQIVLVSDPVEAAIAAAEMYGQLRKKGLSIRSSSDCLIAYYALHFHVSVLSADRDFKNIATHTGLKLFSFK